MLKDKLGSGQPCVGAWILGSSADNAEVLAAAGLDLLVLDHEHGQGGLGEAIAQLRALKGTGCVGLIRVPSNDPVYIKRVLDAGASGIMVPNVTSAEEARKAVAACRYPPDGTRGAFSGMRAMDYGFDRDYHRHAGERVFVVVQVESAAAIDRIDEICAVEGVDLVFIGPRDLSASLGKLNRFDDAAVRSEIARAEQAVLRAGKPLGSTATDGKTAAAMFARGYALVIAGSDMTLLGSAAAAMLGDARRRGETSAEVVREPAAMAAPSLAAESRNQWTATASLKRMRQFWMAWCIAVLLLGAAVIGFGYLFSISEAWSTGYKIGGRLLAGLVAAWAIYDAHRMAVQGTAALQEVLAQNLAAMVTAELECLRMATVDRKRALATRESASIGELGDEERLSLTLPYRRFDDDDVRRFLGDPTEEALRGVLETIDEYNGLIRGSRDGALTQGELARRIDKVALCVNRAMSSLVRGSNLGTGEAAALMTH